MRQDLKWDQPKRSQDWDDRPPPEPKPRRRLRYLPWTLAFGLIAGLAIGKAMQGSDRRDYDRLMAGVGASAPETGLSPTH